MSSVIKSSESTSSAENSHGYKRKYESEPPMRRLRHSYLKLILHPQIWDKLHSTILLLRDQYQDLLTKHPDLINHETALANNQSLFSDMKRNEYLPTRTVPPALKPRSNQSLHITFFFGGQVLCTLQKEELTKWHSQIRERIQHISTVNSSDNCGGSLQRDDSSQSGSANDYTITFRRLRLFPPTRKSLIVAEFHVSPLLYRLYEDVIAIALSSNTSNDMLAKVVDKKHERWVAHVTLADVPRGLRMTEIDPLETLLERTELNLSVQVKGLTMGGPCPQQNLDLGWDFYF